MTRTDSGGNRRGLRGPRVWGVLALTAAILVGVGCEVNTWMDPSKPSYMENTAKTLPILSRLDVIDEPDDSTLPVTQVQPSDLLPDKTEYVIGPGDLITITVFELIATGVDTIQTRRVDETGKVRLPVIGPIQAADKTPSGLEAEIIDQLDRENILTDATVSVVVQESRQNTYSVIGEPFSGSTAFGTYVIPKPDFRLLEALALARGVPGRTKRIMIFRQTPLSPEVEGGPGPVEPGVEDVPPVQDDPSQILEQLEGALDGTSGPVGDAPAIDAGRAAAPKSLESGLGGDQAAPQWIKVGDQWMRAGDPGQSHADAGADDLSALSELITQRIIEIPYERLLNGDMRFNIVIRAGDVIRVPAARGGFVYLMGEVNRPGAYTIPGEKDLTLKQLIASGGNLTGIAIPERVDLVRRIDETHEAMVRLNMRLIFHGDEPDIYLKPNDLVNVGTNFVATPIAIFRNGLRMTYGFGFIVDRNFDDSVFGTQF